jgi:hypothetical protein
MDLAAAAGARATGVSLMWAGRGQLADVGQSNTRCGTEYYETGRRVSPMHGTRSCCKQVDVARARLLL